MSLKITSITLDDFRGYDHLVIDDLGNLVVIVGPNAVGKTNIIEAIQLLTAGSSFVNIADVGGVYNDQWVQAISRWVTTVYGKTETLPRTGY